MVRKASLFSVIPPFTTVALHVALFRIMCQQSNHDHIQKDNPPTRHTNPPEPHRPPPNRPRGDELLALACEGPAEREDITVYAIRQWKARGVIPKRHRET